MAPLFQSQLIYPPIGNGLTSIYLQPCVLRSRTRKSRGVEHAGAGGVAQGILASEDSPGIKRPGGTVGLGRSTDREVRGGNRRRTGAHY